MPKLAAISDAAASLPRAPEKWSRKEIVGHLIDSASNNHERFVRAQLRYRDAPWSELLVLWSHFNVQLARVIEATSPEARVRPRARHNLDSIAFRPLLNGGPATLEYLVADYVAHLEHHLAQILE